MITKRPTTRGRGLAATITAAGLAVGLIAAAAPAHADTTWGTSVSPSANLKLKPLANVNYDVSVPGNLAEVKNLHKGDVVPHYSGFLGCIDTSGKVVLNVSGPLYVGRVDNLFKVVHLTLPGSHLGSSPLVKTCSADVTLPDNRMPTIGASFYGGIFGLSKTLDFKAHFSVKAA